MLVGRAQRQFADLIDNHVAYDALMERIIQLVDARGTRGVTNSFVSVT